MNKYVLEVNNLTKKFGNFTAVNNISFNIKGGEILGFLGPNGAGKTTTIQMLLGVMDQSEGEIKYFGESFEKQRSALLKRINFSSAYIDFPRLFTVKEILKFFAYLYEIPDKDKRIEKLLREFEIEHLKNKTINTLSAGERARLLLTKAFLNYPELILLDEPTASLDPEIAVKIREFLKKEKEEYKVSILLTSHNMREVEEMCDRVIFLNHGKIIAENSPENLAKESSNMQVELLVKDESKKIENYLNKKHFKFRKERSVFTIDVKEKDISNLLTLLAQEKISYQDISINKPNLEDYFLDIIGGNKND